MCFYMCLCIWYCKRKSHRVWVRERMKHIVSFSSSMTSVTSKSYYCTLSCIKTWMKESVTGSYCWENSIALYYNLTNIQLYGAKPKLRFVQRMYHTFWILASHSWQKHVDICFLPLDVSTTDISTVDMSAAACLQKQWMVVINGQCLLQTTFFFFS